MTVRVAALNFYPIKSCRGTALSTVKLTATGFECDRHWMLVNAADKFLTQRELPRMALIDVALSADGVQLAAPGMPAILVQPSADRAERMVTVWRDTLTALDEGDDVAAWLSRFLGVNVRLVCFHHERKRVSSREWTGEVEALNKFSDGYAILAISEASLADLNRRLPTSVAPLPMNRFRPNIVLSGLDAYAEDRIYELRSSGMRLRVVKPCTRCAITTTDQVTGEVCGDEPIKTLKSYRWDAALRGVAFGQNVIVVDGVGSSIAVGESLEVVWK